MNEMTYSANNPNKNKLKPQNADSQDTKFDNNSNINNNENSNKNKKIINHKIISSSFYKENNAKTQIDIRSNPNTYKILNSYKTQNLSSPNSVYKEIRRPLNNRNNYNNIVLNTFSSNANSNHKLFGEKIQNLDIIKHTENSFVSPETEVELIITNANCDMVKSQDKMELEENKVNETKGTINEYNQTKSNNNASVYYDSYFENSSNKKSKQINLRFESPFVENKHNVAEIDNNDKSNLVLPNIVSIKEKMNHFINSEVLTTNKEDKWDIKSYSHFINKSPDKMNRSMISNLSHKSNLNPSLKISISNGISDGNRYELAMSSEKIVKVKPEINANINSDIKENNASTNYVSGMTTNKNLLNNGHSEINIHTDKYDNNNLVGCNNENENYVINENDKASRTIDEYKPYNRLMLAENDLERSSSNFKTNLNERNGEEFSSTYYNNISTDKQFTLEKLLNENQFLDVNSKENKGDLSNLKQDRKIKRNKSNAQAFLQLSKSDVGKLIQSKIQKESARKKDAVTNCPLVASNIGNSPEKRNSSALKNEMLQLQKVSKTNKKLANLNKISEITEETTDPNNNNNNSPTVHKNRSDKKKKLSRSPINSPKKPENNKVLISKNSLYMEKLLFYMENMQRSNKTSQKFEDEFLVLKSEKNGMHEYEKKYLIPPNYLDLKPKEIIEKNKSFKRLEKANGQVKLFEIFSNETLDNYKKDLLMVNDLDLKEKYFKDAKNNYSFNAYNKQHYLNTSLNNNNNNSKMYLNNSHQINNYSIANASFDTNYADKKVYENTVSNPNPNLRSFLLQPKILLRDDILKIDKEREDAKESNATKESFNKTNRKTNIDKNATNSNSFFNSNNNSNTNQIQTKSLESANDFTKNSRMKNSPLILSAENILGLKSQNNINNNNNIIVSNTNNNDLKESENQLIINQSSFLNRDNYSQDLKNLQNEYWQKRRSEPYKYNVSNNNNLNYGNSQNENSNFFNESVNKDLNPNLIRELKRTENAYRSSELQLKEALIERSKFGEFKNLNEKNVEKFRQQKKIEFKNDVNINRKKMDVIESAIHKMVVEATHKAKDNMDLFMYNSSKDELISIEK